MNVFMLDTDMRKSVENEDYINWLSFRGKPQCP